MDEKVEHKIYFDEDGKAVGIGRNTTLTEKIADVNGGKVSSTIQAVVGASSDDSQVIDASTFEKVQNPKDKLSLASFDRSPEEQQTVVAARPQNQPTPEEMQGG